MKIQIVFSHAHASEGITPFELVQNQNQNNAFLTLIYT